MSSTRGGLVEAARRLLQEEQALRAHDPDSRLMSVSVAWGKLALHLGRVIGEAGFRSVYARSLILVARDHPWLGSAAANTSDTSWTHLRSCMETQDPGTQTDAAVSLIATFLGLLATFIGDDLVTRILHEVWPGAFPARASKEDT